MPDAESDAYCLACGGKDLTVYVHPCNVLLTGRTGTQPERGTK